MNTPIRRLSILVSLMFVALLIGSTWIQFVQAESLQERPENRRTLLADYARERGPILVDGEPIAESTPADNRFEWLRSYPQGRLYSHVTGYYSFIYGAGPGIERSRNSTLAGTDDALFYRQVVDLFTGREPRGAAIELTLDPDVQRAAADALGDQRGAVVALDPRTGEILAMVSNPTYDPNALSSHNLNDVENAYGELAEDGANPLVNRAIGGNLYPPGSVFKLITAAAALESGRFSADTELPGPTTYTLPGTSTTLPNFGGGSCGSNDVTTLADSVRTSCNTSFAWLGNELGDDALAEQAEAFGFGQQLSVPMPVTPSSFPSDADDAQVALSAIGQYDVRVTPLQVAMTSAAIANDGVVMNPYLVRSVRDPNLQVLDQTSPQELSTAVQPQVADTLTEMMVDVVADGSGQRAAIGGVEVAGKTGTAEFGETGAAHAWFTGFAPADEPTIAVAVIVESASEEFTGETGGVVAAPLAQQVLQAGLDR